MVLSWYYGSFVFPWTIELDVKLNYMVPVLFSRKFQYAVQNIKNYDIYNADDKDETM